jgi:hypothetical protein
MEGRKEEGSTEVRKDGRKKEGITEGRTEGREGGRRNEGRVPRSENECRRWYGMHKTRQIIIRKEQQRRAPEPEAILAVAIEVRRLLHNQRYNSTLK